MRLGRAAAFAMAADLLICVLAAGAQQPRDDVSSSAETEAVPVRVTAEVDRETVLVAEPIALTISAVAPTGVNLTLPDPPQQLGEFVVLSTVDTFDVPRGSDRAWTRVMTLEGYTSGTQTVPSIEISFSDGRMSEPRGGVVQTKPLEVHIEGVLEQGASPASFHDLKGAVELPADWHRVAGGVAVAALALALGVTGWAFVRRRRKPSSETPAAWALAQLRQLEGHGDWQHGAADHFFDTLAGIVREYVARQYAIAAPKLTTIEFLQSLQQSRRFTAQQQAALAEMLSLADKVKFALHAPHREDAQAMLDEARRFIQAGGEDLVGDETERQVASEVRS